MGFNVVIKTIIGKAIAPTIIANGAMHIKHTTNTIPIYLQSRIGAAIAPIGTNKMNTKRAIKIQIRKIIGNKSKNRAKKKIAAMEFIFSV